MTLRKRLLSLGTAIVAVASLAFAGPALAAFPNFSDCPTTAPGVGGCIDVVNTSGSLNIKGFNVPLGGAALEIRGGLAITEAGTQFVPPRGTNGFFSRAFPVPGGLLGIEWIPGTSVLAITELAGSPSNIRFDFSTFGLSVPVKVRLVNILIGMNCHIGSDSNPVRLNLITGTTSPPAPNRPISGAPGSLEFVPPDTLMVTGNVNVENAFAVPGASGCGLGLGLINSLVNLKLRLPSAAGNNSTTVVNNIAIKEL